MAKIYTSGNYLVCETPNGIREFAKKITVYHVVGTNILIKENDIKLEIPLSEVTNYTNEAGDTSYTVATLTTFLRTNTGNFSTALGGSEATNTKITSGTYTVQSNDYIVSHNFGSSAVTLIMPLAVDFPGRIIIVRRESNTDNGTYTITASGSDTVEAPAGTFASTLSLGTSATARKTAFCSDGVSKWLALTSG